MKGKQMIGDDLIDLKDIQNQKSSRTDRFFKKISNPLDHIVQTKNNLHIWMSWSAKEAAFKAFSKLDPEIGFMPSKIVINQLGNNSGIAKLGNLKLWLKWTKTPLWIHCIAYPPLISLKSIRVRVALNDEIIKNCTFSLSDEEMESVYSTESLLVRKHGKKVIEELGYSNIKIIRENFPCGQKGYPRVYLNQKPTSIDISLSHDGNYCSCSVLSKTQSLISAKT